MDTIQWNDMFFFLSFNWVEIILIDIKMHRIWWANNDFNESEAYSVFLLISECPAGNSNQ